MTGRAGDRRVWWCSPWGKLPGVLIAVSIDGVHVRLNTGVVVVAHGQNVLR